MTREDRDRITERDSKLSFLFLSNYSHNPIHNQTVKTSIVKSISLGKTKMLLVASRTCPLVSEPQGQAGRRLNLTRKTPRITVLMYYNCSHCVLLLYYLCIKTYYVQLDPCLYTITFIIVLFIPCCFALEIVSLFPCQ